MSVVVEDPVNNVLQNISAFLKEEEELDSRTSIDIGDIEESTFIEDPDSSDGENDVPRDLSPVKNTDQKEKATENLQEASKTEVVTKNEMKKNENGEIFEDLPSPSLQSDGEGTDVNFIDGELFLEKVAPKTTSCASDKKSTQSMKDGEENSGKGSFMKFMQEETEDSELYLQYPELPTDDAEIKEKDYEKTPNGSLTPYFHRKTANIGGMGQGQERPNFYTPSVNYIIKSPKRRGDGVALVTPSPIENNPSKENGENLNANQDFTPPMQRKVRHAEVKRHLEVHEPVNKSEQDGLISKTLERETNGNLNSQTTMTNLFKTPDAGPEGKMEQEDEEFSFVLCMNKGKKLFVDDENRISKEKFGDISEVVSFNEPSECETEDGQKEVHEELSASEKSDEVMIQTKIGMLPMEIKRTEQLLRDSPLEKYENEISEISEKLGISKVSPSLGYTPKQTELDMSTLERLQKKHFRYLECFPNPPPHLKKKEEQISINVSGLEEVSALTPMFLPEPPRVDQKARYSFDQELESDAPVSTTTRVISLSASQLNFGKCREHASRTAILRIENISGAAIYLIGTIMEGVAPLRFTLQGDDTRQLLMPLDADEVREITICYHSISVLEGYQSNTSLTHSASLKLQAFPIIASPHAREFPNEQNGYFTENVSVRLKGTCVPNVTFLHHAPLNSIDFGTITSEQRVLRFIPVANKYGTTDISLKAVIGEDTGNSGRNCPFKIISKKLTISPEEMVSVALLFYPPHPGTFRTSLSVYSVDSNGTETFLKRLLLRGMAVSSFERFEDDTPIPKVHIEYAKPTEETEESFSLDLLAMPETLDEVDTNRYESLDDSRNLEERDNFEQNGHAVWEDDLLKKEVPEIDTLPKEKDDWSLRDCLDDEESRTEENLDLFAETEEPVVPAVPNHREQEYLNPTEFENKSNRGDNPADDLKYEEESTNSKEEETFQEEELDSFSLSEGFSPIPYIPVTGDDDSLLTRNQRERDMESVPSSSRSSISQISLPLSDQDESSSSRTDFKMENEKIQMMSVKPTSWLLSPPALLFKFDERRVKPTSATEKDRRLKKSFIVINLLKHPLAVSVDFNSPIQLNDDIMLRNFFARDVFSFSCSSGGYGGYESDNVLSSIDLPSFGETEISIEARQDLGSILRSCGYTSGQSNFFILSTMARITCGGTEKTVTLRINVALSDEQRKVLPAKVAEHLDMEPLRMDILGCQKVEKRGSSSFDDEYEMILPSTVSGCPVSKAFSLHNRGSIPVSFSIEMRRNNDDLMGSEGLFNAKPGSGDVSPVSQQKIEVSFSPVEAGISSEVLVLDAWPSDSGYNRESVMIKRRYGIHLKGECVSPQKPTQSVVDEGEQVITVDRTMVAFKPTMIHHTAVEKLKISNISSKDLRIHISPSLPSFQFIIKHRKITLRSRKCVYLPIEFRPAEDGKAVQDRMVLIPALPKDKSPTKSVDPHIRAKNGQAFTPVFVDIVADSVRTPIIVSRSPIVFTPAMPKQELAVENISSNAVECRIECTHEEFFSFTKNMQVPPRTKSILTIELNTVGLRSNNAPNIDVEAMLYLTNGESRARIPLKLVNFN